MCLYYSLQILMYVLLPRALTATHTSISSSVVDKFPKSSDKLVEEIDDDMLGPSYPRLRAETPPFCIQQTPFVVLHCFYL